MFESFFNSSSYHQLHQFHFLRPEFLWALPVIFIYFIYFFKTKNTTHNTWSQLINPHLLQHLLVRGKEGSNADTSVLNKIIASMGLFLQTHIHGLTCVLLSVCVLAAAGPAWEKSDQPIFKNEHNLVIILDLSLSMYAEDESPSRLVKAKRKISDILTQQSDGLSALIAYSGDAHIVSPLTDDTATISNLLDALEPNIMPKFGSNPVKSIDEALVLLKRSNAKEANIIILSDEISARHFRKLEKRIQQSKINLNVGILMFGSEAGAPIPIPKQGFFKDRSGKTIIAKTEFSALQSLARGTDISVKKNRLDNKNISWLSKDNKSGDSENLTESDQQHSADIFLDRGYYLCWLLLPLFLLFFRFKQFNSLVIITGLSASLVYSPQSQALSWQDVWQTHDQQANQAYSQGDFQTASETFKDEHWKATADYRNGDYDAALSGFEKDDSAKGLYNQGNALMQLGQFEKAIKRYDQALKRDPKLNHAKDNLALAKQLLNQQEQQQSEENQDGESNEGEQGENTEQGDSEGDSPEQSQDGKSQENSEPGSSNENGEASDSKASPESTDGSQQQGDQQDQDIADDEELGTEKSRQESEQAASEEEASDTESSEAQSSQEQNQENTDQATEQSLRDENDPSAELLDNEPSDAAYTKPQLSPEEQEKQQALQQWIQRIPDNPSQLMQNKFKYEHQINRRQGDIIDSDSEKTW